MALEIGKSKFTVQEKSSSNICFTGHKTYDMNNTAGSSTYNMVNHLSSGNRISGMFNAQASLSGGQSSSIRRPEEVHAHANSSPSSEDKKYANKCAFLKRMIGDLLWENSILFERLQRKLTEANFRNEERRRLVRKLVAKVNRSVLNHRRSLPPCIVSTAGGQHSIVLPSGASRVLLVPPERPKDIHISEGGKNRESKDNAAPSRGRKKSSSDKRFVQPIPLDSMGRPIFPIELPGIEVHCLGEIDNKRPGYHTEDLLFPVGFCSSREFAAVSDPLHSTLYTCTVNDNGPEPKFEVSGDDNPAVVYSGRTPDEAVSTLFATLNTAIAKSQTARPLPALPPGKGAQFFGLSTPTIHHLIQGCLGTRKCVRYKPVRYETSRTQQATSSSHSGRSSSQASQQQNADQNDMYLSFNAFRARCVFSSNAASNSSSTSNGSTISSHNAPATTTDGNNSAALNNSTNAISGCNSSSISNNSVNNGNLNSTSLSNSAAAQH